MCFCLKWTCGQSTFWNLMKIFFCHKIDESILNNEAFLSNNDVSLDHGLHLEDFINSCANSENHQQETSASTERFRCSVTEEEIEQLKQYYEMEQLKQSTKSKNTVKTTKWAIRMFNEWREQRKDSSIPDIRTMEKPVMAYWLTRFVMEVRKKSGEEYPSKSFYLILTGILRYLKDNKVCDKNFLDGKDPDFADLVAVIASKMQTLLTQRHKTTTKPAVPTTLDQENTLWNVGVFGSTDAYTLQHTVFFYSCKLFGIKGRDEHRNLKCEQFQVDEDKNGKYIRFMSRDTKMFKGGLAHMALSKKDIKHYCIEGPRCLATCWTKYLDALGNSGDFYRRPIPGTINAKYSQQPVGLNKLGNFMKEICDKGGLKVNFTYHMGNRTRLYNSGNDEQDIMNRTDHSSTATVQQYKRCSDDMHKTVSSVLDPKQPK